MKMLSKHKWIILVLLLGLILRLKSVGQSLWLDEGTTAMVTQMSLSEFFNDFILGDFHPPLYYLLVREVSSMFGISEIVLRSVSIISGLGTIWFVYLIGRKFSQKVGLLASLFISVSGLHIYYSQEARMYALAAFFVALSVYYFYRVLDKPSKLDWVVLGISLSLLSMTHYLTLFIIDTFWLYALVKKKGWNWWKKFLVSHIFFLLTWFTWAPSFYKQLTAGLGVQNSMPNWWSALGKTSMKEIALVPTKFAIGRISFDDKKLYGVIAISVISVYSAVIYKTVDVKEGIVKYLRKDEGLIWFWLVIPVSVAAILGFWLPVFGYFRLLYVLPALMILLALGVSNMPKKLSVIFASIIVLISIMSASFYLFGSKLQREDWKSMVAYISTESPANSVTLFVKGSQMEAYTYYLSGVIDYDRLCPECGAEVVLPISPDEFAPVYDTIWLMRYVQPIFDPSDNVRKMVEDTGYSKAGEYDFNGVVVWRYDR